MLNITPSIKSNTKWVRAHNHKNNARDLRRMMFYGLLLRVALLLLIYVLSASFNISPYYVTDDMNFDNRALQYVSSSQSFIDIEAFNNILSNHNSPLWVIISSLCTKLSGDIWLTRLLNILFSLLSVKMIYKLCVEVYDEHAALIAGKLYAYLPYPIIVCCFPIKDIMLLLACVGLLYNGILLFSTRRKRKIVQALYIGICFAVIYYTREVAAYSICIALFIYILFSKRYDFTIYVKALLTVLIVFLAILFGSNVFLDIGDKIDVFLDYARFDTTIALIRIDGIGDIYKLPITYWFSMMQPIALSIGDNFWRNVLSIANYSLIPISMGNVLYLISTRKRAPSFYWPMLVVYCTVIVLSLSVFRHYYFLIFITLINYAMFRKDSTRSFQKLSRNLSLGMAFLLVAYSLFRDIL